MAKKVPRKAAKRARKGSSRSARSRRSSSGAKRRKHTPTQGLYGWITHTELASNDPIATKRWCAEVFGWAFQPSIPMPEGGEYHLFAYSDKGGGGIRKTNPSEAPHTTFSVHVADARESFDAALRAGAQPMVPPTRVMDGVTIAVVRAPGGVQVGLSGP